MVLAEGLTKTYQGADRRPVRALQAVSFQAQPGQVFGLLGVNGAGKTTCLRILATLLGPDDGRASVQGYDVATDPTGVRRHLGFVSGSTAVFGRLTPHEMLACFGQLNGLAGTGLRARIDELTDRLRMGPFAHRLCDQLSTGQKQRVSIARALLHNPPVLIFDEPTSGLDVVTAQTVMEWIEDLRDEGRTIVLSTHVMSEVDRLCDQVAVLHEGQIGAVGTPAGLRESTQSPTMEAAFLATIGYQRGVEE